MIRNVSGTHGYTKRDTPVHILGPSKQPLFSPKLGLAILDTPRAAVAVGRVAKVKGGSQEGTFPFSVSLTKILQPLKLTCRLGLSPTLTLTSPPRSVRSPCFPGSPLAHPHPPPRPALRLAPRHTPTAARRPAALLCYF